VAIKTQTTKERYEKVFNFYDLLRECDDSRVFAATCSQIPTEEALEIIKDFNGNVRNII
jgi:hypothetical protein